MQLDLQQLIQIWADELEKASTRIVTASLMNTSVEMAEVDITIKVPEPLYEAITEAAEKTGMDPDLIIEKMASEGLQHSLDEKLHGNRATTPMEQQPAAPKAGDPMQLLQQLKGIGLDTTGLEGQVGKFNELMAMLTNMKEMMENAAEQVNVNQGQDTADTE